MPCSGNKRRFLCLSSSLSFPVPIELLVAVSNHVMLWWIYLLVPHQRRELEKEEGGGGYCTTTAGQRGWRGRRNNNKSYKEEGKSKRMHNKFQIVAGFLKIADKSRDKSTGPSSPCSRTTSPRSSLWSPARAWKLILQVLLYLHL